MVLESCPSKIRNVEVLLDLHPLHPSLLPCIDAKCSSSIHHEKRRDQTTIPSWQKRSKLIEALAEAVVNATVTYLVQIGLRSLHEHATRLDLEVQVLLVDFALGDLCWDWQAYRVLPCRY
jgi:hypothetical protein